MKAKGKTPSVTPSPHSTGRDDFNTLAENLPESDSRSEQDKLKKACLKRDNFRCVISGMVEHSYAMTVMEEPELDEADTIDTQAAHIIPFSFGSYTKSTVRLSILSPEEIIKFY